MHYCYREILNRFAPEAPTWFDENAVPRYNVFTPDQVSNIYADQVALILIQCQNCKHPFKVALSREKFDGGNDLADCAVEGDLYFGDPPNIRCCDAGPTMSSDSVQVLEFWVKNRTTGYSWLRVPELEVPLKA